MGTAEVSSSVVPPLAITTDPVLHDHVMRLAAAADVPVRTTGDPGEAARAWDSAPLILIGIELVGVLARHGLPPRTAVVLISETAEPGIWRQAVSVGAQHVAVFPQSERWLIDQLAEAAEPVTAAARTFCVVGGRGGAGATVLATALAMTGMRAGLRTLLVDGDPLGGGIDLVLGSENAEGARWSDLTGRRGRLSCAALRAALPSVDGLAVLSWGREPAAEIPAGAMRTVLSAAVRGTDLVVVDLPRRVDAAAVVALQRAEAALVVVPAEVRAAVAAAHVTRGIRAFARQVGLVVRGPAPGGVDAVAIAETLALPLVGSLAPEPGLDADLERGRPPGGARRSPLAALCRQILDNHPTQAAAA
ncbi:MAG: septum site-determining protein [Streptosporangiales bacterium]|nr:septum site-determining protein [Streptosporangiales bacterium]